MSKINKKIIHKIRHSLEIKKMKVQDFLRNSQNMRVYQI